MAAATARSCVERARGVCTTHGAAVSRRTAYARERAPGAAPSSALSAAARAWREAAGLARQPPPRSRGERVGERNDGSSSAAAARKDMKLDVWMTCLPHAEDVAQRELAALLPAGALDTRRVNVEPGGVGVRVQLPEMWSLCRRLRCVDTIRVRVGLPFFAQNLDQLQRGLAHLPWHRYLPEAAWGSDAAAAAGRVSVSATCRLSRVYHSGAVEERTLKALQSLGLAAAVQQPWSDEDEEGEEEGKPGWRVFVRVLRNEVVASVDVSGMLHRRFAGDAASTSAGPAAAAPSAQNAASPSKRLRRHATPLRETVASVMLHRVAEALRGGGNSSGDAAMKLDDVRATLAAAFSGGLWDPFCGSGTLLSETAALLLGLPAAAPWRTFPLERMPLQRAHADEYRAWLDQAYRAGGSAPPSPSSSAPSSPSSAGARASPLVLLGSDVDAGAVRDAAWNTSTLLTALAGRPVRARHGFAPPAGGGGGGGEEEDATEEELQQLPVRVRFAAGDFEAVLPSVPRGAALVTNAPWALAAQRQARGGNGVGSGGAETSAAARSTAEVTALYARLGAALRARPDVSTAFVLCGHPAFARAAAAPGVAWHRAWQFVYNGAPLSLWQLRRSPRH